jgi:hypothetical protein
VRIAHCAAAVVLIVGLGLSGSPLEAAGAIRPVPSGVVYVDKAELARLHPGWQALSDMKAVLSGEAVAERAGSRSNESVRMPSRGVSPGRSRSELVAKAATDASAALDAFEARKYDALQARCDAMESQLLKSAEAGWRAEARDIERAAAAETKAVDEAYGSDLVNARLRASASQAGSDALKKDAGGMDKVAVEQRLKDAQGQLTSIETANRAAKDRTVAEAQSKIDALRQDAGKRVALQVGTYKAAQRKLIAQDIASARGEIASELGPGSTPLLFAGKSGADSGDTADLSAAVSALQIRIDNDVNSAVLDLAAKRHMQVTFERRTTGARDVTGAFAAMIRKYGWPAGSLAAGGLGSS